MSSTVPLWASTARTLDSAHKFVYTSSTNPTPFFLFLFNTLVATGKTRCVSIIKKLHVFTAPINLKSLYTRML